MEECIYKGSCPTECKEDCVRKYKLDKMYEYTQIPLTLRKRITLKVNKEDKRDVEAFDKLKEFDDNIVVHVENGDNIYLHSGRSGIGKTSWALRIARDYLSRVCLKKKLDSPVILFISVPRYFSELKINISEESKYIKEVKDRIYKSDLVIFDDIGMRGLTQFEQEMLFCVLDDRLNHGKSNIFTSNMNPQELRKAYGERLYSRIISASKNNVIELFGSHDHRVD